MINLSVTMFCFRIFVLVMEYIKMVQPIAIYHCTIIRIRKIFYEFKDVCIQKEKMHLKIEFLLVYVLGFAES